MQCNARNRAKVGVTGPGFVAVGSPEAPLEANDLLGLSGSWNA